MAKNESETRMVRAVHGNKDVRPDPAFEAGLTEFLRARYDTDGLLALYERFTSGTNEFTLLMRRVIWRAAAQQVGHGVQIETGVVVKHIETFAIGNGVFIGAQSCIQGRYDGKCVIGDHTWIGPQAFLDARDLVIGTYVGWGPGAKILGSAHTELPVDIPNIKTDLKIKPVIVEDWVDVGTNAVILPGVTVGKGSIVGAGAVVTKDVPANAVVVGVPARFLRWRKGFEPGMHQNNKKK